jgi:hypothetical protein
MKWQERICGADAWRVANCHDNMNRSKSSLAEDWVNGLQSLIDIQLPVLESCYANGSMDGIDEEDATWHAHLDRCLGMVDKQGWDLWPILEDETTLFRSIYVDQLARWYRYYDPRQIMVWSSEDFQQQPVQHMTRFVTWLGLDRERTRPDVIDWKHHQRDYVTAVPDGIRTVLSQLFKPHNERLYRYLRSRGQTASVERLRHYFESNP